MSVPLSSFASSIACRPLDTVRLTEQASFSGRAPTGCTGSHSSCFHHTCGRSRPCKKLQQQQQDRNITVCFATKSERRRQQQQAEEDDEEDVRAHFAAMRMFLINKHRLSLLNLLSLQPPPSGLLASGAALVNTLLFGVSTAST